MSWHILDGRAIVQEVYEITGRGHVHVSRVTAGAARLGHAFVGGERREVRTVEGRGSWKTVGLIFSGNPRFEPGTVVEWEAT